MLSRLAKVSGKDVFCHLFNIYAEHVMRKALEHHPTGIAVGGRLVNNLRYADDIVLVAKSMQELQDLTNKVKTASEAAGLFLNISKTKVMKVTKSPSNESLTVDNQNVETVEVFNYLGALLTNTLDDSNEVRRRIAIAKTAMIGLSNIWKDRSISKYTKLRLLRALVFPIATYGAECWVLKRVDTNKLLLLNCGAIADSFRLVGLTNIQTNGFWRRLGLAVDCWTRSTKGN